MCLIIHKPKAGLTINDRYIDNAEDKNPDGFGIVYTDTGECITTMDYIYARTLVESDRPFVAHYRYATRGKVEVKNCHPFKTRHGDYLFSNGTVASLGKEKDRSDTLEVVHALNSIKKKHWSTVLSFTETRFAIVDVDLTVTRHGKWHKKEEVFYSKDDCFDDWYCSGYYQGYNRGYGTAKTCSKTKRYNKTKTPSYRNVWDYPLEEFDYNTELYEDKANFSWLDTNIVAVYGTLKDGKRNNDVLGHNAVLLGTGVTVNKYPMVVESVIPYVYDIPNHGHQIAVEVYEIPDNKARSNIDSLEGHPYHYNRKLTSIELDDGTTVTAWLYFSTETKTYQKEMELQACY